MNNVRKTQIKGRQNNIFFDKTKKGAQVEKPVPKVYKRGSISTLILPQFCCAYITATLSKDDEL